MSRVESARADSYPYSLGFACFAELGGDISSAPMGADLTRVPYDNVVIRDA